MSESDEKLTQEESADVEGHRTLADPAERVIERQDNDDDGPDVEGHHFSRPNKGRAHKGRAHKGRA